MAIIQDPRPGSNNAAIIDPMFKALRMTLRPGDFQGAFRIASRTGALPAASSANSVQFSFRYYGTGAAVIHSVKIGHQTLTAYTQGSLTMLLNVVRGFSTSDGGGTQLSLGLIQKVRSAMTQTQTEIRINGTTSTGLTSTATAGIEDPASFSSVQFDQPTTLQVQPMKEMLPMSWFSKPLTLTQFEGFRIRNQTALAANGTASLIVSVDWTEYPSTSTFFY